MSRFLRDRFNRANGALGSTANGKKALVVTGGGGWHEQDAATARGWTVTHVNLSGGGVWPSRTAIAEYDLFVTDWGYNGLDATAKTNAANAYADGVSVYTTGNDTTDCSPLFTGIAGDDGTNTSVNPSGTHDLARGWSTFNDGDLGVYLTGVNASAFTFATGISGGIARPLGVAMENPLTGARWVHLQPYASTHPSTIDDAIYGWLRLNRWQPATPWQVLSGTWTITSAKAASSTSGSLNPLAVVPIGARSNGSCDMQVEILPGHTYGNAVYARVVDANNWIRAKQYRYSTSNPYYITEYEYIDYEWSDLYEPRLREIERRRAIWDYTAWSGYSNYASPTGCRTNNPLQPNPTEYDSWGNAVREFRVLDLGTSGCSGGARKYQQQSRTRSNYSTGNSDYAWVAEGSSLPSNTAYSRYSFTGASRYVNNGNFYVKFSYHAQNTNPGQQTSPNGTHDLYYSTAASPTGTNYWGTSGESAGPTDPATGATRQAGPYYSTTYYYGSVALEKCVGGVISTLDTWQNSSTAQVPIRLTAEGTSLTVTVNGTTRLTATDATHRTTGTKAGIGGASSENQTNPQIDDFYVVGISPERVRVNGAWQTMNPKVRVGDAWVDFDHVKK